MDSVNDMISLMSGQESFTDKKYSEWLEKIAELKKPGYINEDILSLDLYQGQQLIESKKAAMTLHTTAVCGIIGKIIRVRSDRFCKSASIRNRKICGFSCNSESGICNTKQCET